MPESMGITVNPKPGAARKITQADIKENLRVAVSNLKEETKEWLCSFVKHFKKVAPAIPTPMREGESLWTFMAKAIQKEFLKILGANNNNPRQFPPRAQKFLNALIHKYPDSIKTIVNEIFEWDWNWSKGGNIDSAESLKKSIGAFLESHFVLTREYKADLYDGYLSKVAPGKRIPKEDLIGQTAQLIKEFTQDILQKGIMWEHIRGRTYEENITEELRARLKKPKSPAEKFLKSILDLKIHISGALANTLPKIIGEGWQYQRYPKEIAKLLQDATVTETVNTYEEFCAGRMKAPAKTKSATGKTLDKGKRGMYRAGATLEIDAGESGDAAMSRRSAPVETIVDPVQAETMRLSAAIGKIREEKKNRIGVIKELKKICSGYSNEAIRALASFVLRGAEMTPETLQPFVTRWSPIGASVGIPRTTEIKFGGEGKAGEAKPGRTIPKI